MFVIKIHLFIQCMRKEIIRRSVIRLDPIMKIRVHLKRGMRQNHPTWVNYIIMNIVILIPSFYCYYFDLFK